MGKKSLPTDYKLGIYTDIDSIIDTRISIAHLLDSDSVERDLTNGRYFKRISDEIGNIPYSVFKVYYNERNKSYLDLNMLTCIPNIINQHVIDILENPNLYEENDEIILYINIYPYDLVDDELEIIIDAIHKIIPKVTICPINFSNSKILPSWIGSKMNSIFKYDVMEWLEYHNALNNLSNSMLQVMCIAPLLVNKNISKSKFDKTEIMRNIDFFKIYTDFQYLPVKYYSSAILENTIRS